MPKKLLNRHQADWSEFRSQIDYKGAYLPKQSNGAADALTRKPGGHPEGGDQRFNNVEQVNQQRKFSSGRDGSVRVDVLHQSHHRHPSP